MAFGALCQSDKICQSDAPHLGAGYGNGPSIRTEGRRFPQELLPVWQDFPRRFGSNA